MNVDAIFNAFADLSKEMGLADKRDELLSKIKSVESKRCGNCGLWMTSDCKPEKEHGQFKSAASVSCGDFTTDAASDMLSKQFKQELADLYLVSQG